MIRKKSIHHILVHLIKFLVIIAPMFFLFVNYWHPDLSSSIVHYKYETNAVTSTSDFVVGNIYHLYISKSDSELLGSTVINFKEIYNFDTSGLGFRSTGSSTISYPSFVSSSARSIIYLFPNNNPSSFSLYGYFISSSTTGDVAISLDFVFDSATWDSNTSAYLIEHCISPSTYNEIEYVEPSGLKGEIVQFFQDFKDCELNQWYNDLLNVLGLSFNLYNVLGIICFMPLWIFYVNIFEIMLDFLLFIPRIAHKWLHAGYGDE